MKGILKDVERKKQGKYEIGLANHKTEDNHVHESRYLRH